MRLGNQEIVEAIGKAERFFNAVGIPQKDKVKLRILLEEALLRYREKFGKDCEFQLVTRKWLGTPKVLIKIKGSPYNPMEDYSEGQIFYENIMRNLLNYEKAGILYRYENGFNEISAFSSKEPKSLKIPGGSITVSILLAILFALLAENLASQTQSTIVEHFVTPTLDTLFGAIVAVNIPMLFISVLASICAIDDVAMLNTVGESVFLNFLKIVVLILSVTILFSAMFFPVIHFGTDGQMLSADSQGEASFLGLLLSLVPKNIIEPFAKGNILQIVILAVLTGFCITILGDRANTLKKVIMELRQIAFQMVAVVMKLIPLVVFLSIFKTILVYSLGNLLGIWKILAVNYISYFVVPLAMLLKIYIKYDVNIIGFLKKVYPPCLITFTTGSGSASIPKNLDVCKKELAINENLCDFYIPLSHALCPTSNLIGIIAYVFYAAEFSGAELSISQVAIVAFLSVQFSLSVVNESGGILAVMTLLLTHLGLSLDSIGLMMAANIFLVNISGIVGILVRDCDLYDLSRRIKHS